MAKRLTSVRTAIVGVSGYAGGELARLLLRHPNLANTPPLLLGRFGDTDAPPVTLNGLHPKLTGLPNTAHLQLSSFNWQQLQRESIDILFLATPHEQSREWVPHALAHGLRVIDLSGAWRLHDPQHRAIYNLEDADPPLAAKLQSEAVYGLPELHGPAISTAKLVANPGCYATSIILALAPLVRSNLLDLDCGIVCDAKSGVSGAGKSLAPTTHFMHAADNLSAYAVFGHRHTGELLEQLNLTSSEIQFTPHLLPIPRGILSSMYMRLARAATPVEIQSFFEDFFADAPMVRVRRSPELPQIQHVAHTSFCDIGFQLSSDGRRLVVISTIDNLLKGAASQAVQNMNLMAGWHQSEGLL